MSGWLTKKRLFAIHGWLGVILGLPLFIICFSGACAVMSPEIDRLIHPDLRISPPADASQKPLPWGVLLEKIEAASPGGEVFLIDADERRDTAWVASVTYSSRDQRMVLIDPFTGEIRGQRTHFNAQSLFRIFHKQFYIVGGKYCPHGRLIVCSFSIVLLFAAISGLLFYKGWWKSLLRLRLGRGKRIFFSDLHRFLGVWTFLLAMLFAVTGFWYLLERVMEDLGIAEHDPVVLVADEVRASRPPVMDRLSLDDLAARARTAYPEFEIRTVLPGNRPGSVVTFMGDGPAALADGQANQVSLDPHTGEVIQLKKAHGLKTGPRLESWVNPLHFGRFGGLFTKVIWAGAGFALAIGVLAGATIRWQRMSRENGGLSRSQKRWARVSLVLNLLILWLAAVSTVAFIGAQVKGPKTSHSQDLLGEAMAGPWSVAASRDGREGVRFRFTAPGDPNFRAAYAWASDGNRPDGLPPLQAGRRELVGKVTGAGPLRLEIEAWDGSVHAAEFSNEVRGVLAPPPPPEVPVGLWLLAGVFFTLLIVPAMAWLARIR